MCGSVCVQFFVTPWTLAGQAPLAVEFSRQEYCRGLPFPPPGDLPILGIEPTSFASLALAGTIFTVVPPGKRKLSLAKLVFFTLSSLICSLVTLFSKMDRLK